MKTFCNYVALFSAVAVILIAITLICAAGQPKPLSYQAKQFKMFEASYIIADDTYRIDAFDQETRGEFVAWEGSVRNISHTGTSFELVPIDYSHGGLNAQPRLYAFVILDKGYVPSNFRQGTRVSLTGRIHSTSVLSVIVNAKAVTAL